MIFKKNGVRSVKNRFSIDNIEILKSDWKEHLKTIPKFPTRKYSRRGIVYTAGGIGYLTCAWISINLLRDTGCKLPVEIWHLGNEVSKEVIKKFESLQVRFRNFQEIDNIQQGGYILKPLAILHSSFKEVLFLDADNNCVKDPSNLFECEDYKATGTIFWPDYWKTSRRNPIWRIIETSAYNIPEQESGQILVNKEMCWKELNLCLYFNRLGQYYYQLLLGDKDTFKFAWHACETEYFMNNISPATCGSYFNGNFHGNTMVQYGPNSEIYFLHRNLLKWDITHKNEIAWEFIKRFDPNSSKREIHLILTDDLQYRIDFKGDIIEKQFNDILDNNLESKCLKYLEDWRGSKEFADFLLYFHFAKNRYKSNRMFDTA